MEIIISFLMLIQHGLKVMVGLLFSTIALLFLLLFGLLGCKDVYKKWDTFLNVIIFRNY
jgi:hypothetical protein